MLKPIAKNIFDEKEYIFLRLKVFIQNQNLYSI